MATTGCSACLVEAIQCNDENWFRRLLADPQLSFTDTFTIPTFLETIKDFHSVNWPFSIVPSGGGSSSNLLCSHVFMPENLHSSDKRGSTISVVQMAMIFSTPEFNALQSLINSGIFDIRENIIFHDRYKINMSRLRVEEPIAFEVLVDTAHYSVSKTNDFLNTKTLIAAGVWSQFAVIRSMNVYHNRWYSSQSSGVLNLLKACAAAKENVASILALLIALCDIGFEIHFDENFVVNLRKQQIDSTSGRPLSRVISRSRHLTMIDALLEIFRLYVRLQIKCCAEYEMYFSIFLRHGLLFPQRTDSTLFLFVRCLHLNDKTVCSAALRIARQLLAIGFFHIPTTYSNPELKWPRSDHHYYDIVDVNCTICAENRRLCDCITCPRVASLLY